MQISCSSLAFLSLHGHFALAAVMLISWADYDNDGSLDLLVTQWPEFGAVSNLLYHNEGNANAWLEVKLIGTVANPSAIGARVYVQATISGKNISQMREITSGGGRSVQPMVAHFGLGNATNIDRIRIEWPSGTVQQLVNQVPRKILSVTELSRLQESWMPAIQPGQRRTRFFERQRGHRASGKAAQDRPFPPGL